MGRGFPRELDWLEAEALARVVDEAGLEDRLFSPYYDSMCGAMSVFTPVSQERGHWGEVRPRQDPAADIPAGEKVYLLPVPPEDGLLDRLEAQGLIRVHGGGTETSVVTLEAAPSVESLAPMLAQTLRTEALWLADNAVPNTLPDVMTIFLSEDALPNRRRVMAEQKAHAGRAQLAVLIYAAAVESTDADIATGVRASARGWGAVANFIGDETAIDYVDEVRFERFQANLGDFADAVGALGTSLLPSPELDQATDRMFADFFGSR
jgi:hypothetical protein